MKAAPKQRIFVIDDHQLLRQGIRQLIDEQPDLAVCGEADDAPSAIETLEAAKPDLAIVDISLKDSNGLELIKDLKARFPNLAVLVLSMHDEALYAERALRAGARGYVMKREASLRVLEAIRRVLGGGVFVSDRIVAGILDKVSGHAPSAVPSALDILSDRELEVLGLIGQGYGAQQIAQRLHVSIKTVEAHRANMKIKLKLDSGHDLLQFAIRWTQALGGV